MKPKKIILLKNNQVKVVYDEAEEPFKARGILMRPWGIQATLEGRKTQTRRIRFYGHSGELVYIREPYFECGFWKQTKWIKQKKDNLSLYSYIENEDDVLSWNDSEGKYLYRKKPAIHMPREVSRYWLYIEDVHRERLQDITEKDAEKEGMKYFASATGMYTGNGYIPIFSYIWNRINGNRRDKQGNRLPYSWNDNPEIYVVTYRLFFTGRGICE